MYTTRHDIESGRFVGVTRTADGAQIPADPANGDYAAFLVWNAEQVPPVDTSDRAPPTEAERLAVARTAAVNAFLTSNEPVIVATRALLRLAFTWINDERESRGAARILEPDIIALAMGGTLNDGLGDAPVPPSEP